MKILFLTRKWPPAVGGMEVYSKELVDELNTLGIEIDLRALPGRADGRPPTLAAIILFGLRTALQLVFSRQRWDAIHGGDLAIWPLAWIAHLKCPNAPVILAAHGTDIAFAFRKSLPAHAYRLYISSCTRRFSKTKLIVAANSEATANLSRAIGFQDVRVILLACRPIDAVGEPPEGRYLFFAGRLQVRKGLSWFTRNVLPHLPEDVRLIVAGPPWDQSESEALDDPRVDYLGPVDQDQLSILMGGALAVIVPNLPGPDRFEGFGLIAVEAASSGAIVLAADLDGFQSSVIEGQTGQLLEPGNVVAWNDAVKGVLALDETALAARKAIAKTTAREAFSWNRVAREMLALYGNNSASG